MRSTAVNEGIPSVESEFEPVPDVLMYPLDVFIHKWAFGETFDAQDVACRFKMNDLLQAWERSCPS